MNLQELGYIDEVMKTGSINQAAKKLYVAQPALSKCIRRIEKEYDIVLFEREKGSKLVLTEAGECFRLYAMEVLAAQDTFLKRIDFIRHKNIETIRFGTPIQRGYFLSGEILQWMYQHQQKYQMEFRSASSNELLEDVKKYNIDMAYICSFDMNDELHYEKIKPAYSIIYLREGYKAAEKAKKMEGYPFPVLSLEDIKDEIIAVNKKGSASYRGLEAIMEKAETPLKIQMIENHYRRLEFVDSGQGCYFTIGGNAVWDKTDKRRVYLLEPDQSMEAYQCLVCRKDYVDSDMFQVMKTCITESVN